MQCKVRWIFGIVVNWQNSQARKLEMKNNLSTPHLAYKKYLGLDKVGLISVTFKSSRERYKNAIVRIGETTCRVNSQKV